MFKTALRSIPRSRIPSQSIRPPLSRRFLNTAPPHQRSRSWKSSALRWGLAIGGIYYYNTSHLFAEEPAYSISTRPDPSDDSSDLLPTLGSISKSRQKPNPSSSVANDNRPVPAAASMTTGDVIDAKASPDGSPQTLEEEASQEGAFNPETGEINWDCPCLGGMAHGPCGEQFRAAFSCFVYSTEEPKGMDCVDRFKGMQDCFREHPDIYGSELEDDEDELDDALAAKGAAIAAEGTAASSDTTPQETTTRSTPISSSSSSPSSDTTPPPSSIPRPSSTEPHPPMSEDHAAAKQKTASETAKSVARDVKEKVAPQDKSKELMPKEWHDTRDQNKS